MNKRILVIDDTPEIRRILLITLEYEGYQVLQANNGADALRLLKGLGPDELPHLMMLDLMMPVMDGYTFFELLHQEYQSSFAKIPVIIMTAKGDSSLKGGRLPQAVLKKPMHLDEMLLTIKKHL